MREPDFIMPFEQFRQIYFINNRIFYSEDELAWYFYVQDGLFVIKSEVKKRATVAENNMFVAQYLTEKRNIIYVQINKKEDLDMDFYDPEFEDDSAEFL